MREAPILRHSKIACNMEVAVRSHAALSRWNQRHIGVFDRFFRGGRLNSFEFLLRDNRSNTRQRQLGAVNDTFFMAVLSHDEI